MFDKDKNTNNLKAFDISLDNDIKQDKVKTMNKQKVSIIITILVILFGCIIAGIWYNFYTNNQKPVINRNITDTTLMFVPIDEITINLRHGIENTPAWLRVKITLEVHGQQNYDIVMQMSPKILDMFQTYLKELRKSDLDGSFGIYKMKDEMAMRINTIIHPAKIENILFQEFLIQTM